MGFIHQAIRKNLWEEPNRKVRHELYASDLGKHPGPAMYRATSGSSPAAYAHSMKGLLRMSGGKALEKDSLGRLQQQMANVYLQFPLYCGPWSGEADAVIWYESGRVSIVEHKATSDRNFTEFKYALPTVTHCAQLWMYGWLYEGMYAVRPSLHLYYRGWEHWAEFSIMDNEKEPGLIVTGCVDGDPILPGSRNKRIHCDGMRKELEYLFEGGVVPDSDPKEPVWEYAELAYDRLLKGEFIELWD